jgi:hypothetical protein
MKEGLGRTDARNVIDPNSVANKTVQQHSNAPSYSYQTLPNGVSAHGGHHGMRQHMNLNDTQYRAYPPNPQNSINMQSNIQHGNMPPLNIRPKTHTQPVLMHTPPSIDRRVTLDAKNLTSMKDVADESYIYPHSIVQ